MGIKWAGMSSYVYVTHHGNQHDSESDHDRQVTCPTKIGQQSIASKNMSSSHQHQVHYLLDTA